MATCGCALLREDMTPLTKLCSTGAAVRRLPISVKDALLGGPRWTWKASPALRHLNDTYRDPLALESCVELAERLGKS